MADWDGDSTQLRANLRAVLQRVAEGAAAREPLTLDDLKHWHARSMHGLDVPDPAWVGRFRGEPGLEVCQVMVGDHAGVAAADVAAELQAFARKLEAAMAELDAGYPTPDELDLDGFNAVVEVAGWAHSEWVRIHPFANGNGRTVRILANAVLMRHGLPPVPRLRPRPNVPYASAGIASMSGDWQPMVAWVRSGLKAAMAGGRP